MVSREVGRRRQRYLRRRGDVHDERVLQLVVQRHVSPTHPEEGVALETPSTVEFRPLARGRWSGIQGIAADGVSPTAQTCPFLRLLLLFGR